MLRHGNNRLGERLRLSSAVSERVIHLAVAILLVVVPVPPAMAAKGVRINDTNIPFLYESRADIPAPNHKLAEMISSEYRNAQDEFTRRDLFQQTKPVIERRLREARETQRVYLRVGAQLAEYDFDKAGFPSGFGENTYINFSGEANRWSGYQARFANVEDFSLIPVSIDKARELASALRRSRKCSFVIEGGIDRAEEVNGKKVLYVAVDRVEVSLASGANVATLAIGSAEP